MGLVAKHGPQGVDFLFFIFYFTQKILIIESSITPYKYTIVPLHIPVLFSLTIK
jgi:hypothetical protein